MEKPRWLDEDEQADILRLLGAFVDKLDDRPADEWVQPPAITVNAKHLPSLFIGGEKADLQWKLIQVLSRDYGVITIRLNPKRDPFGFEYANARLVLHLASEDILRNWLQRPRKMSSLKQWQAEVDRLADKFPGETEQLRARQIRAKGKTAEQVLQGFLDMGGYCEKPLTLRQLSACCFWGHSKFLEGRKKLVKALYPDLQVLNRPLVVNVHLPKKAIGMLFIENQDSYLRAVAGDPAGASEYALIYCAGFKGGASRLRSREGVSMHFHNIGDSDDMRRFESWWFDEVRQDWPVYFWGDLDYSGMAILKALKKRFNQAEAWQIGYQPMLQCLEAGGGHGCDTANKQKQIDPESTGCCYTDEVLLPAIRRVNAFVDQEFVAG